MPLEENPYTVPHLKALNSGHKLWGGQRFGSTLRLWNSLLKISILLHRTRSQRFILIAFVFRHLVVKKIFAVTWTNIWLKSSFRSLMQYLNALFLFEKWVEFESSCPMIDAFTTAANAIIWLTFPFSVNCLFSVWEAWKHNYSSFALIWFLAVKFSQC